ncbi:hypothetical protein [Halorussus salinus]|uniref:hypothetical protein n=1 Tax=Halorussus salinus TaxID=1364935 RepID=UPI001092B9CA|nr:hypothetical protein [Halorussus salinus]
MADFREMTGFREVKLATADDEESPPRTATASHLPNRLRSSHRKTFLLASLRGPRLPCLRSRPLTSTAPAHADRKVE